MAFNCVFTNVGKGMIPSILAATAGYATPSKINWGTGTGTTSAADTTLFTKTTDEADVTCSVSTATTTNTNDTLVLSATQTCATNGKTVTNAGVFDASARMLMKADFTGVPLNVGDSIVLSFKLQFT
jgi:hypothetical protein